MKEFPQKIINVFDKEGKVVMQVMHAVATPQGLGFIEVSSDKGISGSENQEVEVFFPRWLERKPLHISSKDISPCNTY